MNERKNEIENDDFYLKLPSGSLRSKFSKGRGRVRLKGVEMVR